MAAMERSLPELPEDVILHIFSHLHLNNQQALRLGLLSKQVFGAVQKRRHLVFDCISYHDQGRGFKYRARYFRELKYTHSTLARYFREAIPLQTFTLKVDGNFDNLENYKLCLRLAAKIGLKNLNVMLHGISAYCLPDTFLENMIRGSPSIENLKVNTTSFSYLDVKVANLPNLKHLELELRLYQDFKVTKVPKLESVVCFGGGQVLLVDSKYKNLKSLHLGGLIDTQFFTNFARKFPVLEKLSLEGNQHLHRIDLSSASLKEIRLKNKQELKEASFDVPSLVRFSYKNHTILSWEAESKIVPKLSFIGDSGGWSSCIELDEQRSNIHASWFQELKDFLFELNGPETSITVRFNPLLLLNSVHRTFSNSVKISRIKEFSMSTDWAKFRLSSASAILDGIFWICQPQTITFVDCNEYKFPKLLYEKLISRSCQEHPHVTGFEMFQGTGRFKDWEKLVEMLEVDDKKMIAKNISFQLQYSSQMLKQKKVD